VDIALYALGDYGVLADVDCYRGSMLHYTDLLAEQKALEDKFHSWHTCSLAICNHLTCSQARSHLHPYLVRKESIPTPFKLLDINNPNSTTLTMVKALMLDMEAGDKEDKRPWYQDQWGVKFTFPHPPNHNRCMYCTITDCPHPHARCHTTLSCIIPPHHRYYGPCCTAHYLHVHNDSSDIYPGLADHNPALEDEGYVGHEDEEGNGEP
jgi:hypothetical protein